MLINSVIIVLREMLEAALLISVLLSIARSMQLGTRWLWVGLVLGFVGAAGYGASISLISDLFDGVGQEVVNALLQVGIFVVLSVVIFLVAQKKLAVAQSPGVLPIAMMIAVALAVVREGSEVMVFVSGYFQLDGFLSGVGLGSLAGVVIGCSVGVLFYYFLAALQEARMFWISLGLLILIAGGMIAQASGLLIQADWLSGTGAVWNTSGFLPEDSLLGQLLYALIGYEATPSATEVTLYMSSILVAFLSGLAGLKIASRDRVEP